MLDRTRPRSLCIGGALLAIAGEVDNPNLELLAAITALASLQAEGYALIAF